MTRKSIDEVVKEINKIYGRTIICRASEAKLDVHRVGSGSFSFDIESGGGIPRGRIIEYFGFWSSCKTSFTLHNVKEFQKAIDKPCLWIDSSGTFDKEWAENIGVDLDRLHLCQVKLHDKVLNIMGAAVESNAYSLIVLDDVASVVPMETVEKEGEANITMGAHARIINRLCAVILGNQETQNLDKEEGRNLTTVILINQVRSTMDQYHPEVTTGGKGKEFFSSLKVEFKRGDFIKVGKGENTLIIGHQVKGRFIKNKTAPRERRFIFDFYIDDYEDNKLGSINRKLEVLNYAILWGVVQRKGPYYYLGETPIQGKEALIELINENQSLYEKIEQRVKEKVFQVNGKVEVIPVDKEAEKEILGDGDVSQSSIEKVLSGWGIEEESGENGEEVSKEDSGTQDKG